MQVRRRMSGPNLRPDLLFDCRYLSTEDVAVLWAEVFGLTAAHELIQVVDIGYSNEER